MQNKTEIKDIKEKQKDTISNTKYNELLELLKEYSGIKNYFEYYKQKVDKIKEFLKEEIFENNIECEDDH